MINNGLFDIIGNNGGSSTFDFHPTQRVVAYESGCYVTLWDLEMDKKLMIHPHDCTVTCIKFFGPDNEYLLSVDGGYKPSIFITEWQTMTRIHQIYLPTQKKNQSVQSFHCAYSKKRETIILAENYRDQYSLTLWDFKLNNLSLVGTDNDENQEVCLGLHLFDDSHFLDFAVAERRTVKYWRYERERLDLLHRIHVKEDILDSVVSTLAQFFLFTTKQGRLFIINKEGQLISSLKHPNLQYSCVTLHSDYLFLGSLQGEIEIYQLSSMKFLRSLKDVSSVVRTARNSRKSEMISSKDVYQFKKQAHEQPEPLDNKTLIKLVISKTNNIMALKYADNNIFMYDIDKGKIMGSVSGHSKKVKEIHWEPSSRKRFVTCSSDGSIRVWSYIGDRWESYCIYPPVNGPYGSNTLSNSRGFQDPVFRPKESKYKITCLQVDWINNEIYAGDNQGSLHVYDLASGEVKRFKQVGGFKIKELSLGSQFLGVSFSNGTCFVMERQKSFESQQLKLEEPVVDIASKQKFCLGIKLIENDNLSIAKNDKFHKENSSVIKIKYGGGSQYGNSSYVSEPYMTSKETTQRIITVHNISTLRLHQLVKSQGYLNSIVLANYHLQGRVLDFAIHASNDYLLVLSNENLLYIFKIATGEIKAKIEMPKLSHKIALDPSGLYVIVASPFINYDGVNVEKSFTSVRTYSPNRGQGLTERNIIREQTVISLFEIWTGEYLGQIHRLQSVSSLAFSYEGSYLSVGTVRGIVSVLTIDENLRENIYEALDGLQQNPFFWSDFQLDFGEKRLLVEDLTEPREDERENTGYDYPPEDSEREIQNLSHELSRSYIRAPQQYNPSILKKSPNRQEQTIKFTQSQTQSNRFAESQRIPTMKNFLETKKIQPNSSQSSNKGGQKSTPHKSTPKKSTPKAILIEGTEPSRIDQSQQMSKITLPNASFQANQDRAKEYREQIRAVNFGRKNSEDEAEYHSRSTKAGVTYKEQVQQTTPKYLGPIDKVIDLVATPKTYEQSGVYRANIAQRNIQSDPSDIDIDDDSIIERNQKVLSDKNVADLEFSQTMSSRSGIDDISDMYDDISEFEKRFYRKEPAPGKKPSPYH